MKVVEEYIKGEGSSIDLGVKYNISSGLLRSWAAYYKWLHREVPDAERKNIKLAELIKEYDERFHHILGYRRMTSWINHFNHTAYSKNRVHRIMKKLGIHSVIRKKKKKYICQKPDETAENILQRDFYASAPNQKWATDITAKRHWKCVRKHCLLICQKNTLFPKTNE